MTRASPLLPGTGPGLGLERSFFTFGIVGSSRLWRAEMMNKNEQLRLVMERGLSMTVSHELLVDLGYEGV